MLFVAKEIEMFFDLGVSHFLHEYQPNAQMRKEMRSLRRWTHINQVTTSIENKYITNVFFCTLFDGSVISTRIRSFTYVSNSSKSTRKNLSAGLTFECILYDTSTTFSLQCKCEVLSLHLFEHNFNIPDSIRASRGAIRLYIAQ